MLATLWEGTSRPAQDPCFHESAKLLLCAWRGLATRARIPSPADERILGHVMYEFFERHSAVSLRIFDLFADLAKRLALPSHLDRRQVPLRMPGYACRILVCGSMTVHALHRDSTKPCWSPHDERQMRVAVLSLQWPIASRMTVDTTRMRDDLGRLIEQSQGTFFLVRNLSKILGRLQRLSLSARLRGTDNRNGEHGKQSRCERARNYLHLSSFGLKGDKGR